MTTITIDRTLLEQALDVIIANTTGKDDLEAAIRAELAKPVEPQKTDVYAEGGYAQAWNLSYAKGKEQASSQCWCEKCRPIVPSDMRMVLCPDCGNKRCPKATDHRNPCTGSNKPGQPGSSYPAPAPIPAMHGTPDVAALKAERDAAMKDAERYRWLRHGDNDEKVLCHGPIDMNYWYLMRNEKLDAAIDAAIAKAEGRKK